VRPRASRLACWAGAARAASDTGSWAHVERARHVGNGELGSRRTRGAGPVQRAPSRARGSWARVEVGLLRPRARATPDTELGRCSPARFQVDLLGPCSARHVGHGSWARCSPARLQARLLGRAARATSDIGVGPASRLACCARARAPRRT
jgi:hypothetical protein